MQNKETARVGRWIAEESEAENEKRDLEKNRIEIKVQR